MGNPLKTHKTIQWIWVHRECWDSWLAICSMFQFGLVKQHRSWNFQNQSAGWHRRDTQCITMGYSNGNSHGRTRKAGHVDPRLDTVLGLATGDPWKKWHKKDMRVMNSWIDLTRYCWWFRNPAESPPVTYESRKKNGIFSISAADRWVSEPSTACPTKPPKTKAKNLVSG